MTNRDLVDQLVADGVLTTSEIIAAFRAIDRADFVPELRHNEAYDDHALPIGYGQTISQPSTVAFMFELLQPKKGERILDVGSGSGWTTALLASVVGESGLVDGVELIDELVSFGKRNLRKYGFKHADISLAKRGVLGLSERGPYNRILVSASAENYPKTLENQLATGGRMVIPVGTRIMLAEKTEFGTRISEFPGFVFVPLI